MICIHCNQPGEFRRSNTAVCKECERKKSREYMFFKAYGITLKERDRILEQQGGKCAACGSNAPGSIKGWHLDHCHRTNKIRSVLCATCNIALGQVNDSIERLQMLIDYLRKSNDHPERE